MTNRRNIGFAVLIALAVFVWGFGTAPRGDPIPAVDCPFDSREMDVGVTCFQVPVGTGTVLATVLHTASDPLEAAPVLVLGPDHGATPSFDLARYATLELLGSRDLVLVDPVGTERTAPALECLTEVGRADVDSIIRCRDRAVDAGLLSQWSSGSHVEHLALVHEALAEGRSWQRWHVVARGHGAQIALHLANTHPDTVSTLVLGSVPPAGTTSLTARARAFRPALDQLDMDCRMDGGCSDLGSVLAAVDRISSRLLTAPEPVETTIGGTRTDRVIDEAAFQSILSRSLETPTLPEIVPWSVARIDGGASEFGLASGARDTLAGLASAAVEAPTVDSMLWWHLTCSEEMPMVEESEFETLWRATPGLIAAADPRTVCADWPSTTAPVLEMASERPTLVLEPTIDPLATPDSAGFLSGALTVPTTLNEWLPGQTECSAGAIETFFDDPRETPPAACLAAPVDLIAHPVPVGTVRQIGGLGETGAMAMGTAAAITTVAVAVWIQLGRPPGWAGVIWRIAATLNAVGFIGSALVLVTGSDPARLIAQPWWAWATFGLPWFVGAMAVAGGAVTVHEVRTGVITGRWPPRYALAAIGIVATVAATALLGTLPGA